MSSAHPPDVPSEAELRRIRRAQRFLAARMSARIGEMLDDQELPIEGLRHFPGPNVDIGVVRGRAPHQRDMLAWARHRQLTLMAARLSESEDGDELTVDTYLWDVGVVILNQFLLFTPSGESWWLVGKGVEVISLKLTHEGPVATLTRPYRDEGELAHGLATASRLLSASLRAE